MVRRWVLTLLALLALAPFLVLATHAKKGGNKPPPEPPPPADPAIAYVFPNHGEVLVMNADGSNQTIVYKEGDGEGYWVSRPSWSGDGEHIAFAKRPWGGGDGELWCVDVAVVGGVPVGSNARVLVDGVDAEGPAWSPTSDVIAFTVEYLPGGEELRLVHADSGAQQLLYTAAPGDWISREKAWSPDGTLIAFFERIGGVEYIRVFDLATETITTPLDIRSENHTDFNGLSWARTDDLLAYSEQTSYVVVKGRKEYTHYMWTLRTLDPDTGVVATVTSGSHVLRGPSWSPDDSKLAVWGVGHGVDSYDIATGLHTELTPGGTNYPDWRR